METMVDKATDPDNIHFLITIDTDDPKYSEYITAPNGIPVSFTFDAGTSASKVDAVNRGMDKVTKPWDILLLASDDMHCKCRGWDNQVRMDMAECYPNLDGLLWYFDGHQKDICTMPIMGVNAYELDGYIYDPRFKSLWCDNFQTDVWRKQRGKMTFLDMTLFDHQHPAWGRARWDALYKRNEELWMEDEKTYRSLIAA